MKTMTKYDKDFAKESLKTIVKQSLLTFVMTYMTIIELLMQYQMMLLMTLKKLQMLKHSIIVMLKLLSQEFL